MDNLTIKRALSQAKAAGPVRVKEQLNAAGIMEMLKGNGLQDLASASAYLYIEAVMEKLSLRINDLIEIGHHNGLSTALLTKYAKRIYTFDISARNEEYIWALLGCRKTIRNFIGSPEQIRWELRYIKNFWPEIPNPHKADFAFIDGGHDYDDVLEDFEAVRFTKRVLFHDYNCAPGVNAFCKEIGAQPIGHNDMFAYWKG